MIFFRIGCIALILTACLHMVGHFIGPIPQNETEKQLLDLMTNYKMNLGNETVTMMGFHKGFSLVFTLFLIMPAVIGLYLAKVVPANVIRMVNLIFVGFLLTELIISQIYFFIIPTTCVAVSSLFFIIAAFRIKTTEA